MSKATLDNAIRNNILAYLRQNLADHFETDVMDVGSSGITMPVVDEDGNEKWAVIKVTIPRGTRTENGFSEYDGYAAHDEWNLVLEDRAARVKRREEKQARVEAEKERKRALRQTVKTMKADIQEILPSQIKNQ